MPRVNGTVPPGVVWFQLCENDERRVDAIELALDFLGGDRREIEILGSLPAMLLDLTSEALTRTERQQVRRTADDD